MQSKSNQYQGCREGHRNTYNRTPPTQASGVRRVCVGGREQEKVRIHNATKKNRISIKDAEKNTATPTTAHRPLRHLVCNASA